MTDLHDVTTIHLGNHISEVGASLPKYYKPFITAVACSQTVPSVTNGHVATPSTYTYLTETNVVCDEGYEISSSAIVSCQADATWSTAAACTGKVYLIC